MTYLSFSLSRLIPTILSLFFLALFSASHTAKALYNNFDNPEFELVRGQQLFDSTTAAQPPAGELLKLRLSSLGEHLKGQVAGINNPALTEFYGSVFGTDSQYGLQTPAALVELISPLPGAESEIPIENASAIFEQLLVYLAPYIKPSVADYIKMDLLSGLNINKYDVPISNNQVAIIYTDLELPVKVISPESAGVMMKDAGEVFFTKQDNSQTLDLRPESFEVLVKLAIILFSDYLNTYKTQLEDFSSSDNWSQYDYAASNLYMLYSHFRTFFRDLIPYLPKNLTGTPLEKERLSKLTAISEKAIPFKKRSEFPDLKADYDFYNLVLAYLTEVNNLFEISKGILSHLELNFDPESCYGCTTINDYLSYQRSSQIAQEDLLNQAIRNAFEQKRKHDVGAMRMIFNRMKATTEDEINKIKSEWGNLGTEFEGLVLILSQMISRIEQMKPQVDGLNDRVNRIRSGQKDTEDCLDDIEGKQFAITAKATP